MSDKVAVVVDTNFIIQNQKHEMVVCPQMEAWHRHLSYMVTFGL